MMKTLKRAEECPCDRCWRGRAVTVEEGETRGWGDFDDKNPLKGDEKCP